MRPCWSLDLGALREHDRAQRRDVVRQEGGIEIHARIVARVLAPRRMTLRASGGDGAAYPAISGRQVRAGILQSIPSSDMAW
jgi:hypothetical protein